MNSWASIGKTYGTHDFSGVGMGPAPVFDVTQMPTHTIQEGAAGPMPRGVKRQADS